MDWQIFGLMFITVGLCIFSAWLGYQMGRVDQHVNQKPIKWAKVIEKEAREKSRKEDKAAARVEKMSEKDWLKARRMVAAQLGQEDVSDREWAKARRAIEQGRTPRLK